MATDHVWTLRSALEQALVLYEGEYGDAYKADDEQGSNFWAGHIATVRSVLAEPDEQAATIARLESELLYSEEHSREGWATASERCAERDAAQALAESRGRRVEELETALRALYDGTRDVSTRGLGSGWAVEYEMPPSTNKAVRKLIAEALSSSSAPPSSPSLGQRIGAAVDTRCIACGMVDASPVCLSCGAAK